ncbi:hypothetical protein NGR_c11220 [Sinorhizobium fredii NGR234]|uniref:Uncharacterized protein n=1 Tax=Sinorhizobium fredii (strain NBRC 101917 / NGR234) TaxID=394 RepID=C3MAC8_SINFN|nr:hypothetical protein NGR_c11220 [Sinorhizobium fredii NGR234]
MFFTSGSIAFALPSQCIRIASFIVFISFFTPVRLCRLGAYLRLFREVDLLQPAGFYVHINCHR